MINTKYLLFNSSFIKHGGMIKKEDCRACLCQAGCSEKSINEYMKCESEGNFAGQLRIIDRQRDRLLRTVHEGERKISSLDYLKYSLERERETDEENRTPEL